MDPNAESTPAFPTIRTSDDVPRRSWLLGRTRRGKQNAIRLRWYQFTVRRMLLLVLIISIPLAWLGRQGLRHLQRRRAAAQIVALGGQVHWDTDPLENTWYGRDLVYVQSVTLENPRFPPASLKLLGELPALPSVALAAPQFDDASLEVLAGLTDIEFLYLRSPTMTDAGLARLASQPLLRSLTIFGPQFTDACIAPLTRLPRLEHLRLANVSVSADGLRKLRRCSGLRDLDLEGPWVNASCLGALAELRQLTQLGLLGVTLSPTDFAALERLKSLVFLQLEGGTIVDGSLKAVARLPRLTFLELNNTGLTSAGLADLRGAKVTNLELIGGAFDDDCLPVLESLPLRILTCLQCGISDDGLAKLKRAKPELLVVIPQPQ